jgi:hypothetical protein
MKTRSGIAGMVLATGLFTSFLGACVLAVDFAPAGGAHCKFAGVDSECGRCVADKCSVAVDACCFDDSCGGVIHDVEGCAAKSTARCAHLADASDRGGAHAALSSCVESQCASPCGAAPPAPPHNVTHCGPSYVSSVETCECQIGQDPANDTECTEVGHPGLRCCAPDGWPGQVRTCECKKVICVGTGDGCLCELGAMDDQNRPVECTGTSCCYDPMLNSCTCGSVACRPEETKVAACNIGVLGCEGGLHHVDTCTVPKP